MRVFKLTCASLLVLGYFVACGSPPLPSTTPLGGHEDPDAGPDASADAGSDGDAAAAPSAKPKASAAPAPTPPPSAPPVPSTPPPAPSTTAPPEDAGAPDAAPVAAAPKCDDSGGDENACSRLPAPDTSMACPAAFVAPMLCKSLAKVLKPKVTEAMVGCLNQKIQANQCDPEDIKPCAFEAIKVACVKKAYKKTCEGILSACPNPKDEDERELFNQSTCEQGLASLQTKYRKSFADCAKRECGIGKCIGEVLGDGN
ncbi:MAG: hypothetical protein R3B07_07320 [Polyangiaceae bacterium]